MERSQRSLITPAIIFVFSLLFMMVNPFHSASAALGNGVYSVPYTVIKPDDGSASMADGYLVKPATVTVKDGSYTVNLTIKNSSWITEFKPNGANPAVISTSGDTKTVQFSANITSPVVTKMKVDIDDMNYHHEYTVRLSFNTGGAKLISGGEEKPKEETKQEEKKEPTTTAKVDASTKEKTSESTSSTTSKKADAQTSKQASTSATKSSASSESTKTAAESSEKTSVVASSENQEKKAEEKETAVTNEDEKVTKEESEEKEAVKEEVTEDKDEDAEESKQTTNTESSDEQTASANFQEEEKGIGPIIWSILAGIIVLGLGLGIYRYKVRKQ